jgi:hypothetical protein
VCKYYDLIGGGVRRKRCSTFYNYYFAALSRDVVIGTIE